jgi:hypothetical protein
MDFLNEKVGKEFLERETRRLQILRKKKLLLAAFKSAITTVRYSRRLRVMSKPQFNVL